MYMRTAEVEAKVVEKLDLATQILQDRGQPIQGDDESQALQKRADAAGCVSGNIYLYSKRDLIRI